MTKRVVVTGGAGFIGSHLVASLVSDGCDVVVLDDLSGGCAAAIPIGLGAVRLLTVKVGSTGSRVAVEDAVARAEMVFHLAGPIGVARAHHDPQGTANDITSSTTQIVNACHRHQTPLLFTSSSEAYGPVGQARPLDEDDLFPFDSSPRWSYGRAKLQSEQAVARLAETVDTWVVRLFNVVGPGQRPDTGLVVAAMCSAALARGPLVLHDGGRAVRSFLHVADAVRGLRLIAASKALRGAPVNLGGSETFRIADVAQLVSMRAPGPVEVRSVTAIEVYGKGFAAVDHRTPDLSRLRAGVGFKAEKSLVDAIDDTFRVAITAGRVAG